MEELADIRGGVGPNSVYRFVHKGERYLGLHGIALGVRGLHQIGGRLAGAIRRLVGLYLHGQGGLRRRNRDPSRYRLHHTRRDCCDSDVGVGRVLLKNSQFHCG